MPINGLVFMSVNPYDQQITIGPILVTVAADVVNSGARMLEAAQ